MLNAWTLQTRKLIHRCRHKESIAEDIRYLQESKLVRDELKKNIHGYLFDIKTGELIPMSD
jgi:carbonic anhydrase